MDIRQLNRYCRKIINASTDGLMVVGLDGIIIMVNTAMEAITGFGTDELIGASCELLDCDACELIRSAREKKWCRLFEREKIINRRCMLMKKDRSYVSVIQNASLLKNRNGKVIGALESFTNISELEKQDLKIQELSNLLNGGSDFYGLVGKSPVMQKLYRLIEKAAQSNAPVLITGESGTGKELVARAIHDAGRRKNGPFVNFNCAALNPSLLESELFGHAKGAFTGAYQHRKGRFEAADRGDIFFDEIGEFPVTSQAKLLRVIETKQFERVGDCKPVYVDVRIISATNRNLMEMISQKTFRQDLFFRINILPIHLPPLRERKEDITLLVSHFIHQLRVQTSKKILGISPEVMDIFMTYDWPGNVRELRSALEYAFVVGNQSLIEKEHLPDQLTQIDTRKAENHKADKATEEIEESDEKAALIKALQICRGNKTQAAKMLGIHRMTVWNRMRKYGIHLDKKVE